LASVNLSSKPRTKPAEERRDDLMNSAERLFLEQGVGATSIEQITAGADVAKGTFYLHFSSKAGVLEALQERFGQRFLDHVKAAVDREGEGGWERKLAAWARACVTEYLDAVRLHDLVFHEACPSSAREGMSNNVIVAYLTDLLAAGVREKAWPVDDPRFTAVFLFNALHGVVDEALLSEKTVDRARLTRRLTELCFRTVGLSQDEGPLAVYSV